MKSWRSDKNRTGLIRQSQKQGLISSRLPGVLPLTRKYAFLYMSLPALRLAGTLLLGRVPAPQRCVPGSLAAGAQDPACCGPVPTSSLLFHFLPLSPFQLQQGVDIWCRPLPSPGPAPGTPVLTLGNGSLWRWG